MGLSAPTLFTKDHIVAGFDCGNDTLNGWLSDTALKNQLSHASKTYVACKDNVVQGYYCLASGSVERTSAPGSISRKMPDPIPVIVLGRLAVDLSARESGLLRGKHLLKDAIFRTLAVSQSIGVRALLVHAIDEAAREFYLRYGFKESRIDPMTLLLSIKDIESMLE